jgi:hypothetical protein
VTKLIQKVTVLVRVMLTPLLYTLKTGVENNLNTTQDKVFKGISKDYPFQSLYNETDDHFVARTYLQFLWLPEVRPVIS